MQGFIVADKGTALPVYDSPTTLAIHRIKACDSTRREARVPDIPEPNNAAFGIMEGEPFTAVVRFAAAAATYVAERQWSAQQSIELHADGSLTLHVQGQSVPEFLSWVLSFGKAAEVLSPAWLRAEVGEAIKHLYKCYTS